MAKQPEIEHEYHAKKDTLKIKIHGYALTSKASRDAIMKKVILEVEKNPARLIAVARNTAKNNEANEQRGLRRD